MCLSPLIPPHPPSHTGKQDQLLEGQEHGCSPWYIFQFSVGPCSWVETSTRTAVVPWWHISAAHPKVTADEICRSPTPSSEATTQPRPSSPYQNKRFAESDCSREVVAKVVSRLIVSRINGHSSTAHPSHVAFERSLSGQLDVPRYPAQLQGWQHQYRLNAWEPRYTWTSVAMRVLRISCVQLP